jgi:hypothetical protein
VCAPLTSYSYFYFYFIFFSFSISLFSILHFLCIFNNIKLTYINYLPKFCILITTKYLGRYRDSQCAMQVMAT